MVHLKRKWLGVGGITAALLVGALATISAQHAAETPNAKNSPDAKPAAEVAKSTNMPTCVIVGSKRDVAAEAAINQKLDKEIDVAADNIPLNEFVDSLMKKTDLTIQLDQRALEAAGVGFDTPISRNLSKISARSTLHLVLKQLDLTFMIQNEVLLITTAEEASNKMQVRIYPVRDLIVHRGPHLANLETQMPNSSKGHGKSSFEGGSQGEQVQPMQKSPADELPRLPNSSRPVMVDSTPQGDAEELLEIVRGTVQYSTWDEVGGQGSVLYSQAAGSLVVSQTADVHQQIAALLDAMREAERVQQ